MCSNSNPCNYLNDLRPACGQAEEHAGSPGSAAGRVALLADCGAGSPPQHLTAYKPQVLSWWEFLGSLSERLVVHHHSALRSPAPELLARLIRGKSCHECDDSYGVCVRMPAVAPCHRCALKHFICVFGCFLSCISKVNISRKISSRPLRLGSLIAMLSTSTINIQEVLQGTELSFPLPSHSRDDSHGHAVLPCTNYGHLLHIMKKTRGTAKLKARLSGHNVAQQDKHTLQPPHLSDLSMWICVLCSIMSSACAHPYKKCCFLHKSLHPWQIAQGMEWMSEPGAPGGRQEMEWQSQVAPCSLPQSFFLMKNWT